MHNYGGIRTSSFPILSNRESPSGAHQSLKNEARELYGSQMRGAPQVLDDCINCGKTKQTVRSRTYLPEMFEQYALRLAKNAKQGGTLGSSVTKARTTLRSNRDLH